MPHGFGKPDKQDNRSRSQKTEATSAADLGGRLVSGSGSTPFAKGDILTDRGGPDGTKGYCYQQKTGVRGVNLTNKILDKHVAESMQMKRTPVIEVIIEGGQPWYCVPRGVWQELTNERRPQ
jgi:hypothetical protein